VAEGPTASEARITTTKLRRFNATNTTSVQEFQNWRAAGAPPITEIRPPPSASNAQRASWVRGSADAVAARRKKRVRKISQPKGEVIYRP